MKMLSLKDYPGWVFTVSEDTAPSDWALEEAREEGLGIYFILAENACTGEKNSLNSVVTFDEASALLDNVEYLTK